jgi:FtsZ-binding cell division protein ZapB
VIEKKPVAAPSHSHRQLKTANETATNLAVENRELKVKNMELLQRATRAESAVVRLQARIAQLEGKK